MSLIRTELGDINAEMTFGGRRNPDGQGIAVFDRVTKGMDVVHKIHARPAQAQQLTPPARILPVQILED
ncbi:MAG: hypothetical protein A2Y77_03665 [Planctomycetes bacterium RBG_13_62_9]|nr:MAG: hypothetical protein A2Y77_03665 [Planctomycetes bacterium RBG_13_62_9]